jgi:hypothetical protein
MPDAQKTISVRAPMKMLVLLIAVQSRAAHFRYARCSVRCRLSDYQVQTAGCCSDRRQLETATMVPFLHTKCSLRCPWLGTTPVLLSCRSLQGGSLGTTGKAMSCRSFGGARGAGLFVSVHTRAIVFSSDTTQMSLLDHHSTTGTYQPIGS